MTAGLSLGDRAGTWWPGAGGAGVTFPTSGSLCSGFAQLSCFGELKGLVLCHNRLILKHVFCSLCFDVDVCCLPSVVFCKAQ